MARFSAYLPAAWRDHLDKVADHLGVSVMEVIRRAVLRYLLEIARTGKFPPEEKDTLS